jgi:hypothetical protein
MDNDMVRPVDRRVVVVVRAVRLDRRHASVRSVQDDAPSVSRHHPGAVRP